MAAVLSGLVFTARRLRTGSLWPPILVHALWDFATFSLSAASGSIASHGTMPDEASVPARGGGLLSLLAVQIVLPNAIYGLWLMRHIVQTRVDPER